MTEGDPVTERDTVTMGDELLMPVPGRRPLLELFPEYDAAVGCYCDPETEGSSKP